jgi:sarcosine oxidase, subunit beta
MDAEIVIAGAGVIGCSIAFHLAERGCRDIVVVDRAPDFGAGSTSKATGGFRRQFAEKTEILLSIRSLEVLLADETSAGFDSGYAPRGYLFLARTPEELEALREAQRLQHACGVDDARMIDADAARALNPAIGDPRVIGGAFAPRDGFLEPMNILRGYASAAQKLGVRFLFNTNADEIDGEIRIEARGAWSGAPVTPVRRNIAATIPTDILPQSMPMTIWAEDWYHLRVRDGRVLLLWPDDPPNDDVWLEEVLRRTRERVPCLRDIPIAERWSGFYEMTPDERMIFGKSPHDEHLYVATGCSGHGVMHSPAIGALMAELILDGKTSIDMSELSPARFSESAARST